ncbi:sensor domain-containing diguanylate cyclase [Vallitalea guaymasensis]|uniref:sensor domain-containing diguanylate cyclase n=1 Tax=Vallitalea guaymasensis TaxID=1185412 RepID=UPI002352D3E6|nr:sensor domain-containing diguanylate cyclase [Vallitalea guaymasensis]
MCNKLKSNLDLKIIFRSFIIIFTVFSISSIFVYQQTTKKFRTDTTKQICLKSQLVNKDITNIFENKKIISDIIEADEDVYNYLLEVKDRNDITTNILYPKVINNFKNIIKSHDDIYTIWVANEQANFYIDAIGNSDSSDYDIYKRPWREQVAGSDEVILTDPYIEYGTSIKVISIIKTLRQDDKIIGYVGIDITLDKIFAIMENYIVGEKGMNFLINKDYEFIYSYVGENEEDIVFKNKLIESVKTLDKDCRDYKKITYKQNKYFIYHHEIDLNGWGIIQLIPENDIDQDINDFLKIMLIIFSIAAISLLIIIIMEGIMYKLRENRLKIQARTDSLTGSINRSYFMELAKHEFCLAKKENRKFNLLMIDIDYFKSVNDNYGHHIGDVVLENMARLSVSLLGKNAIFGRVGGEEFAAIIMDIDEMEAFIAAEDLRTKISNMDINTDKGNISINVSIGLTSMKNSDIQLKEILKRADEAMYEAKKSGRNKVKIK